MDLTLIYVLYLLSSLILPIFFVDTMSRRVKHNPIDWVVEEGNLRNFIYYLKLIYFIPFIIIWVVATLVVRLVKFILFKDEK